jgi:GntR family carbon starvation induced transcriptional regulator
MVRAAAHPNPEAPPTLAEWVDSRLRTAILSGELAPGEKLRSEHLAAQWGVSPTPLREAFQRLAGDGLVVIEAQKGARVAEIDVAEAVDLYELRLTLDPKALHSAMGAADDAYRARVESTFALLARRHRTVASFLEAHRAFHLAVLSACTNRHLYRIVVQLHDHTQRFQVSGIGLHRREDPLTEHRALRDAVIAGDVDHAVKVLTAHLQATIAEVGTATRSDTRPSRKI